MTEPQLMHASCVSVMGRGVLICGPSGSGKSTLALHLMACGADLVADDQTVLTRQGDRLVAACPPALSGLIEARGVGILTATPVKDAQITLVADLGAPETERLPPLRYVTLLGLPIALVMGRGNDHFSASVLCYLKGGRQT